MKRKPLKVRQGETAGVKKSIVIKGKKIRTRRRMFPVLARKRDSVPEDLRKKLTGGGAGKNKKEDWSQGVENRLGEVGGQKNNNTTHFRKEGQQRFLG